MMGALLWGLLSCSGSLTPISGSTVRVGAVKLPATELGIHIFRDTSECSGRDDDVDKSEAWYCDPWVDRESGQVRFAFQSRIQDETTWPMTLTEADLVVTHQGTRLDQTDYKVVGHNPVTPSQMFILLIDTSGSMSRSDPPSQTTRIERVRRALLRSDVIDAFFPDDAQTAVVPLVFSSGTPVPMSPKVVLRTKTEYKEVIAQLNVGAGYTHLYRSIRYAATDLLARPEVSPLLQGQTGLSPTIIALTDGFNNEDDLRPQADRRAGKVDICGDNARRLEELVVDLDKLAKSGSVRARPTVYTVGLGRAARPRATVPAASDSKEDRLRVTPRALCGSMELSRIDGGIEERGVDNVAMAWIAVAGRGQSYIRSDTGGLAEAFKGAAAKRYRWFDIRYEVPPFYLRRSFDSGLQFVWGGKDDGSQISLYPSAWLDAPPGVPLDGMWTRAAPFSRTAVLLFPILGFLVTLNYLPSAWFNLLRVFFSRVRRKRRP